MLQKAKLKQLELSLAIGLTSIILLAFLVSIILGYWDKHASYTSLPKSELALYAREYLPEKSRCLAGKRMDCSSFTRSVFKHFSIQIPPSSIKQYAQSSRLLPDELQTGDLVFFNTNGKGVSHVGIYLNHNEFIHSPGRNKYVRIDSLNHTYYASRYLGGGRVQLNGN